MADTSVFPSEIAANPQGTRSPKKEPYLLLLAATAYMIGARVAHFISQDYGRKSKF